LGPSYLDRLDTRREKYMAVLRNFVTCADECIDQGVV